MDKYFGHYLYLFLNFASVLFPFILSFDKKVAFYKKWRPLFISILIVAIFFIIWDAIFTIKGVWGFNSEYILGIKLFGLPLEELLFFITVPYSCMFIYECTKSYAGINLLNSSQKTIGGILGITFLIISVFYYNHYYTLIAFGLSGILLILHSFIWKSSYLGTFLISFLICLIPFWIINGILTVLPVVWYNDLENLGIRLGSIPADDIAYNLAMLLGIVTIYERILKNPIINK